MIHKLISILLLSIISLQAQENLRIGVLAFGTVNWELDVLKHHNLDKKYGFDLDVVELASKNAQLVSLQSKDVNMIVNDWIWVNTQKAKGKNFSFYPYSKATGTLLVNENSNINTLLDLKGKHLGIAGGVYDKTWLLFRAYSKSKYDIDLKDIVNPLFASAPILYKKMQDDSLQAAINFWHFNAKLESKNIKALIEISEILKELDIQKDVSFVGWTFDTKFANENKDLINAFLKASKESKEILKNSDEEWNRIKEQMSVKNDKEFEALKNGYKKGIIEEFDENSIGDLQKVFKILLKEGGEKFVEDSTSLDNSIFWNFDSK
ncbi:nitrate/sulfonate/bicarbonate ABC transporter, periplasmic substrate-binding protein [Arcobacter acticola]|jgi:NitT/TauT family transport system substrate-binding protein|uniref:Nitrate/sulfonate/bicarbonate ABC transporter, periplasmic substrate-binding protein n=1 Tax=Arcobacter acticola TaxID=1849015 RepID=A0A6M8ECX3_9BACT|nr:ABC transporter substrate-binding protein [Arcobacter acticola]QKE27792.1 nitrate/sulfonate/bicarbonate ABC transporter, periplasmic substrate-binding protein [Arcobacter acticola]